MPDSDAAAPRDASLGDQDTPIDLKVKLAEQKLYVTWRDGTRSEFSLPRLRALCPCATCKTEREKQSKTALPILKADPTRPVQATGAELVGRYAIHFDFSDGHNTGIYDFRFLRALSEQGS